MKRSPERVAWTMLFGALFICIALGVGVPTAVFGYINSATNEAFLRVRLRAGQVQTKSLFESVPSVVDLTGRQLRENVTVDVRARSLGLLAFSSTESAPASIYTYVYANTEVRLRRARIPRYETNTSFDALELELINGRIEIDVPASTMRRFQVLVTSAAGDSVITKPGRYTLEMATASKKLLVTVHDGTLNLTAANGRDKRVLSGTQRAQASVDGTINTNLPAPTNLVRNGFFRAPLTTNPPNERDWVLSTTEGSTVRGTFSTGDGILTIERAGTGIGWGRKTISQTINETVQGRSSLKLRLAFSIFDQELSVCGSEGSECPLFARINYVTTDNVERSWLQGFYAKGDPEGQELPTFLKQNRGEEHISQLLSKPEVFETGNLLDELIDIRTIKSIDLYAEGHALKTEINSVELLLED
jgi:hypothetical protein